MSDETHCKKCKRPIAVRGWRANESYPEHCDRILHAPPDPMCAVVAAAYQRGRADGLEPLAREDAALLALLRSKFTPNRLGYLRYAVEKILRASEREHPGSVGGVMVQLSAKEAIDDIDALVEAMGGWPKKEG